MTEQSRPEQSDSDRLKTARDAIEYALEHHANGNECLCAAARSVLEAGWRLSLPESRRS
jgi:hypothetical protein